MPTPTFITPATEADWLALRAQDITSTEIPALFGCSPYETAYALWQRKRGALQRTIEETERMKWGKRLEPAIAAGFAEDRRLTIAPMKAYARHATVPRMGASFDYSIEAGENLDPAAGKGILEIKNVDARVAREQWETIRPDAATDDSEDAGDLGEAPLHIELQLQHQLEVADREFGYIVALVGGNTPLVLYRERDRALGAEICRRVTEFWASIAADEAPAPDFRADAETIARLHGYAEPGKVADWRIEAPDGALDLLAEYERLGNVAKETAEARDAVKAELLTMVGDAEKVTTALGNLTLGMVGEARVEYVRKPFRMFRFTAKKVKEAPVAVAAVGDSAADAAKE